MKCQANPTSSHSMTPPIAPHHDVLCVRVRVCVGDSYIPAPCQVHVLLDED